MFFPSRIMFQETGFRPTENPVNGTAESKIHPILPLNGIDKFDNSGCFSYISTVERKDTWGEIIEDEKGWIIHRGEIQGRAFCHVHKRRDLKRSTILEALRPESREIT